VKVNLERSYPVPADTDASWALLQDIESLAACMPGARITERVDERCFRGSVNVRLGPAAMAFRGELQVTELDAPAHRLRLLGKGTDTGGGSAATLDLQARIEAEGEGASRLVGASEVSVNGKAAAFGGRMMGAVAEQVLAQFAENFARRAAQGSAPPPGPAEAAPPPGASAAAAPAPAPAPTPPPAGELDGLALLWSALKAWLRALFGRRAA
jgi:carbon monoxide dehydrogenase subunit G